MEDLPGMDGQENNEQQRIENEDSQLKQRKIASESDHNDCEFSLNLKEHMPISALKAVNEIEGFVSAVWGVSFTFRWSPYPSTLVVFIVKVVSHNALPDWLKDNEYLRYGHRPQLNSYLACFKSIFRLHTETGNIWTHLLGCVLFIIIAVYLLINPRIEMQLYDHVVFVIFFVGAISCLSFSWLFHTLCCHSPGVGRLWSKMDYTGISLMVMGSFVPWLYYGFYCDFTSRMIYMTGCITLGSACIAVSMLDRFASASYRPARAGESH